MSKSVPINPALLLPRNNLVACYGDSRLDGGYVVTTGSDQRLGKGIPFWVSALSRGKFSFPAALNFAHSGYTSEQQEPFIDACCASTAAVILFFLSTNDRSANWDAARSITSLNKALVRFAATGKLVIVIAEAPRGANRSSFNAQLNTANLRYHQQVRQWLRSVPSTYGPNVIAVDPYPDLADRTSTNGWMLQSVSNIDNLHLNNTGGYLVAMRILDAIGPRFPPVPFLMTDVGDEYEAATNPRGNLLMNKGYMIGTGGTFGSNGGTGSLAAGWSTAGNAAWIASALTTTFSKVTTATGDWQQVVISGTAGAGAFLTINTAAAAIGAAGTVVDGSMEWEVDPGAVGLQALGLVMSRVGGTSYSVADGYQGDGEWPAGAVAGTLRTPALVALGTESGVGCSPYIFLNTGAVNVTIRMRAVAVRKYN